MASGVISSPLFYLYICKKAVMLRGQLCVCYKATPSRQCQTSLLLAPCTWNTWGKMLEFSGTKLKSWILDSKMGPDHLIENVLLYTKETFLDYRRTYLQYTH